MPKMSIIFQPSWLIVALFVGSPPPQTSAHPYHSELADEVVANATALEQLLRQLQTQQSQGENTTRQTEMLITSAEEAIAEVR